MSGRPIKRTLRGEFYRGRRRPLRGSPGPLPFFLLHSFPRGNYRVRWIKRGTPSGQNASHLPSLAVD